MIPTLHPQTRGAWHRAVARSRAADTDDDPVCLLPDGYDPDGYVRAFGIDALRALLGASPPPALFPPETPLERERRETWEARLNDVGMRRLRERCRSGAALEDAAIVDDARERKMMAERARQERELKAARGSYHDDTRLSRASAYLAACPAGMSGQGRDSAAWHAVNNTVRRFALSESEAMALLESEYAPRCKPRLPRDDLRGKVRRALRGTSPPWGCALERKAGR